MTESQSSDYIVIKEFLEKHPLVTLATSGSVGEIEQATNFVYVDDNLTTYSVSRIHTRKVQNIEARGVASFFVANPDSIEQLEYVAAASVLEDAAEIADVLPKIQQTILEQQLEYWVPPVTQIQDEGYVVLRFVPSVIRYRRYAKAADTAEAASMEERTMLFE